jgi:hypothetical protein
LEITVPQEPRTYASVLTETTIRFADDMESMAELSSRAFRVHFEALMFCTLNDFPMRVEKIHVPEFARSEDPGPAVAELVALGWWVDDGDYWLIGSRHGQTA